MRRWPLTARGTGALVLAACCAIAAQSFAIAELVYVAALLVIVVVLSVVTLYLVRGEEKVVRVFSPDVATAGDEVTVRATVRLGAALPGATGRWTDALPHGIGGHASGVFSDPGSPNSDALEYRVVAEQRGIRGIGPLSVETTDLFGLSHRHRVVGTSTSLTITPAIVDLVPVPDTAGDTGGSRAAVTDQFGQGSDNLAPRGYLPGDSMRRIHWRASAHRDQLMVRQEEQETTPEATVVLDLNSARWDEPARRAPGADPAFEDAVSMCLSVITRFVRDGYVVSLLDGDGAELVDPIDGGDMGAVARCSLALASVTAHRTSAPANGTTLIRESAGPLAVITGLLDEQDVVALAPLVHRCTLPLLLAAQPRTGALTLAETYGWRTAAIGPGGDPAVAWQRLAERGAPRVGA